MPLPAPQLNWSPKRNGDSATLVNIDTWVWLTDRNTNLYVEASADGVTARVDANLTAMTVSAPNGEAASCEGGGVPYATGASGECSIPNQPALATDVTPIGVREIQAIGAR